MSEFKLKNLVFCGLLLSLGSNLLSQPASAQSQPSTIQTTTTTTSGGSSAETSVSSQSAAVASAQSKWLSNGAIAAARYGCTGVIEQRVGESLADAIRLFGLTATKGNCLLLQPISTSQESGRYSLAWGGKVDGVDILYISDLPQIRIWNAKPVASK